MAKETTYLDVEKIVDLVEDNPAIFDKLKKATLINPKLALLMVQDSEMVVSEVKKLFTAPVMTLKEFILGDGRSVGPLILTIHIPREIGRIVILEYIFNHIYRLKDSVFSVMKDTLVGDRERYQTMTPAEIEALLSGDIYDKDFFEEMLLTKINMSNMTPIPTPRTVETDEVHEEGYMEMVGDFVYTALERGTTLSLAYDHKDAIKKYGAMVAYTDLVDVLKEILTMKSEEDRADSPTLNLIRSLLNESEGVIKVLHEQLEE